MNVVGASILCCVLLAESAALPQLNDTTQQNQQPPQTRQTHSVKSDRGQQIFNQNCSRCHSTPDGFSPHISGSIAKHTMP